MATLNHYSEDAPRPLSDIVLEELSMGWCREAGILAPAAAPVPMGAVLGMDESGRYVPYMSELRPGAEAPETQEGTEAQEDTEGAEAVAAARADRAVAVLISKDLPASEDEQPCTVIRRGACVAASNLYWSDSVTDDEKTTALSQLSALGIVPKE